MKSAILFLSVALASGIARGADAADAATQQKVDEYTRKVDELQAQLKEAEKLKHRKILSPYEDIDFLYRLVINSHYEFRQPSDCLRTHNKPATKPVTSIKDVAPALRDIPLLSLFSSQKMSVESAPPAPNNGAPLPASQPVTFEATPECKLAAVEEFLGLTSTQANTKQKLVDRIDSAYKEVGYDYWKNDRIRFALVAQHVNRLDTMSTALAVHAYPTYRSFAPNRVDLWRRMSFFLAVSAIDKPDGLEDIKTPSYAAGIAFDITHGIAITFGYGVYKTKQDASSDFVEDGSVMGGISLTSELWEKLFSNNGS